MDDEQLHVTSALLLIVGEPFSEEQKLLILAEITKGFKCFDIEETQININEELAQIANRASLGEEGSNGERIIQHNSDKIAVEILVNPLAQTVKNSLKKLLVSPSENKYVIFAGTAFQGSGAWILQDDTFSFSNLVQVFKHVEVENALKQNIEANLTIHTVADSNWGTSISKSDFTSHLRIQLNPPEKLDNIHGVLQFTAYISSFLKPVPITSLLQASEQFGNIGFTRPTIYIFPGCQGDSALFGINGFSLLVNGGYSRRACFWDFARHLDRVDAMLMTHLGTDNIFGLNTVLQRKSLENIHPQIGYLYFNAVTKEGSIGGEGDSLPVPPSGLLINLAEEASKVTQMAKQLGLSPQPCLRSPSGDTCEPINLYHKLGHGSLDMYVLNPVADSKELKEFYQAWSKQSVNLGSSGPFPLQNALSVCALLVWKPYNLDEKIVRIFFPGNAPQHKVIEGLEKVKTYGFMKFPSCTSRDLIKPPPVKKPLGGTARPGSSRPAVKSASNQRSEPLKSAGTTRTEPLKKTASSPTKTVKTIKEETNKKKLTTKEKPAEVDVKKSSEKDQKGKSSSRPTSASPIKRPTSPSKAPSPTKAKSLSKSPSPPKSPIKSPVKTKAPDASDTSSATVKSVNEDKHPETSNTELKDNKPDVVPEENRITDRTEVVPEPVNIMDSVNPEVTSFDKLSSSVDEVSSPVCKVKSDVGQNQVNGGDHLEAEEEEVKPQALPEPPVILESPSQDSDAMPDYSSKIESDEQELSEFSRAEEELQDFEGNKENILFSDPAQEIPSSPEPIQEEQSDYGFSEATQVTGSFETPVFAHDGPDPIQHPTQLSMEQNIQYGINDSSNVRDMGGIQEVDEEEQDDDNNLSKQSKLEDCAEADKDEENVPDDASQTADTKSYNSQETEDDDVKSDTRISAERQFEDAEVDDTKEYSQSPVLDGRESSLEHAHDEDSIDGNNCDDDKDVDESTVAQKVNGISPEFTSDNYSGFQDAGLNPFIGVDKSEQLSSHDQGEDVESDDEIKEGTFNPEEKWGPPMGLPLPINESGATSPQKSNGSDKRLSMTARAASARTVKNDADAKKRPNTAPTPARGGPARSGNPSKKPLAASRSSPMNTKVPPLPPMTPYYVDLTYIPNHGDPAYSDIEFFKRVRARYYVISALSPNTELLSSLMEAKSTWEQKDLEVTLIPTYDSDSLRHWFGLHKEKLQELRIDLTPAVSRCTIQLQDLETSLPAYRLEV